MIATNYHVVNGGRSEPFPLNKELASTNDLDTLTNELRRKHGAKRVRHGKFLIWEPEIFINTLEKPANENKDIISIPGETFKQTTRSINELMHFSK